jgi:cytochrome P450
MAEAKTTASSFAGLFARLFYNPAVYNKLVQEIRSKFASADEITHTKIHEMPYVLACVQEGLRIHPPVPAGNMRMVPGKGDTIDGQWIPGGTTVSVGNRSASHNPLNFRNPDDLIPERWIGEEYFSDIREAMQPFSLGPRNCLGKK